MRVPSQPTWLFLGTVSLLWNQSCSRKSSTSCTLGLSLACMPHPDPASSRALLEFPGPSPELTPARPTHGTNCVCLGLLPASPDPPRNGTETQPECPHGSYWEARPPPPPPRHETADSKHWL